MQRGSSRLSLESNFLINDPDDRIEGAFIKFTDNTKLRGIVNSLEDTQDSEGFDRFELDAARCSSVMRNIRLFN